MGFEGSIAHPLTYRDLAAWSSVMKTRPHSWEVQVLLAMDRVRVCLLNGLPVELDEPSKLTVLTAETFDRLFPL